MAVDPHFHPAKRKITVSELSVLCDLQIFDKGHQDEITHACSPSQATTGALILIGAQNYLEQCASGITCTIITTNELAPHCPKEAAVLIAKNPRLAFAVALQHLYQTETEATIAASAHIAASARLGQNITIGEGVVIEEGVSVGDNVIIGHHCVIGAHCQIGDNVSISDHSALYYSKIANDVHIGQQCVIGKQGFGFEMTEAGAVRVPHLGLVEIGKNVEIGAHCVIDRGVLGNTVIDDYVMIDNLVHIAHNVEIGEKSLILGQVGIAGSTIIGKNTIIGGQVGIKDHVSITDNVMVMSGSKVTKSITKPGAYVGFPAQESKQHWREMAALKRLIKKSEGI